MFILTVAGLADKSSLNMTQQYAEVRTVANSLCLGTQFFAWMIRVMHLHISLFSMYFPVLLGFKEVSINTVRLKQNMK